MQNHAFSINLDSTDMNSFDDFSPNSQFGMPLSSFPPGSEWSDTRRMIADAFSDLCIPWVRNYLFHSDPLKDAQVLSNPHRIALAMPVNFTGAVLSDMSGGFQAHMRCLRYNVPAFSVGDIGVGLALEWAGGNGSSDVVFTVPEVMQHFVINRFTGVQVIVSEREQVGTVDIAYMKHHPNGMWTVAMMVFNAELFRKAFLKVGFDWDLVERALIKSIIGGVYHHVKPLLKHTTYPFRLADNSGEHCMKSVFSSYLDGKPVMAFPVFLNASWEFEYDSKVLESMRMWGLSERFGRLSIKPSNNAPVLRVRNDSSLNNGARADTVENDNTRIIEATVDKARETQVHDPAVEPSNDYNGSVTVQSARIDPAVARSKTILVRTTGEKNSSKMIEFTKIAPGPCRPNTHKPQEISHEDRAEQDRLLKLEKRKLQKREAAARSNAKKSAERRRLKLERQRMKSAE